VRLIIVGVAVVMLIATGAASGSSEKGDGPKWIVTGYGSVWVGTGDGSVIRIDPRTHRIVQRIDVSFTMVQGLAPAYGSLWVATGTGLLKRIDPATGRVRDIWTPDVCTSQSVAVAAGSVWVLDSFRKRLCRIDPARNSVIRRISIDGGEPLTLRSDSRRLWLGTNTDPKPPMVEDHLERIRLLALDPSTGLPLGPRIDTAGWVGFSAGFGSLYANDPIAGTVARMDPASGRTIALRSGLASAAAPAAGLGAIWLPVGTALRRLDPDSLASVAEVPVAADLVAVGAGGVWALDTGDGTRGTVTKVDPRTNRVVGRPIRIVPEP
jgi:streptogramin lyase